MKSEENNNNTIDLEITEEIANQRLDMALFSLNEVESRSLATKLIQDGSVNLIGSNKKLKASNKAELGQIYQIILPELKSTELTEYDFPLDILFEDDDLIIVNKPAGLVVHPSAGHESDTLVNALLFRCKDFNIGLGELRPGIVHRLDKDTSGVMVVAKTNFALEALTKKFHDRTIERFYWAICVGNPKFEETCIESEIGRHPVDRKKISSKSKHGKYSKTDLWKLNNYHDKLSLMKFKLHTGRTHQIRVHCSENHFPILGDWVYSSSGRLKSILTQNQIKEVQALERFCLHAAVLGFEHPRSGEMIRFYVDPPTELKPILEKYNFLESIKEEFKDYGV